MGQRFWQTAQRDMAGARLMLQPDGWYIAAYLAHQATEKALKAAHWHLRAEEAPWTHDVADVAERLADQPSDIPAAARRALSVLEPVYEQTRYPSGNVTDPLPADLFGETEARAAIAAAEEVMAWAQMLLARPPGRPRSGKGS
jgi:HEPN domain-containing protein